MFNSTLLLHNNEMSSIERTKVSRWQNINPSTSATDIKHINNTNIFSPPPPIPSSAALPNLISVSLPSLVSPPTQPAGPLRSQNIQSLLGEVPNLLKNHACHQQLFAMPPNIPPLRLFEVNEQRQTLPNSLVGFFPNQQQQNFLPNQLLTQQQSIDFVNTFLVNQHKNPTASLNNAILSQLSNCQLENVPSYPTDLASPATEQQQHSMQIPVPPLPPNISSMEPLMVPPPPPPLAKAGSNSQCLADSPMDIEDDQEEVEASEKEGNANGCEKKVRNQKVQMADELMKRALRPYFKRRRITKDEYKEIMKKGVAKLKKRHSLKAEKVEKFVSEYVQLVAAKRTDQHTYY